MLKYADIYTNIASLGKVFTCIIKSFNMGYETLMMMLFDSEKPTMLLSINQRIEVYFSLLAHKCANCFFSASKSIPHTFISLVHCASF